MINASFYEPLALEVEVKRLIRKHNLYHRIEPYATFNDQMYFHMEGPVENYNAFQQEYWPIKEAYEKSIQPEPKPFWQRAWEWIRS